MSSSLSAGLPGPSSATMISVALSRRRARPATVPASGAKEMAVARQVDDAPPQADAVPPDDESVGGQPPVLDVEHELERARAAAILEYGHHAAQQLAHVHRLAAAVGQLRVEPGDGGDIADEPVEACQ